MSPTAILIAAENRPPCPEAQTLRNSGIRVAEACSGADVKRLLSILRPDAVLVDAALAPAVSADVWRALDQSAPAVHVVMLGTFRHETVRAHAREHGAICVTPQSEEDLVAAVHELIRRYQAARQENERLHAKLSAHLQDFQSHVRKTYIIEERKAPPEGVVILVAEDDECVRRFVTTTLERSGYIVLEAADGKEAVRALWNYGDAVRLVILDWAMPELSGVDVVRTMRKIAPETRVLICTGSPEAVIRQALQREAVEGILEKPFLSMDLLEEVDRQMREVWAASGHHGHAGQFH